MVCWVGKLPVSGYQLEAARRGMSQREATRSPPCPYEVGRPFMEGVDGGKVVGGNAGGSTCGYGICVGVGWGWQYWHLLRLVQSETCACGGVVIVPWIVLNCW